MGTILKFNSKPLEITDSNGETDLGEVVFFPGVRYERHDRVKTDKRKRAKPRAGAKKARATRNRKRNT